jgi:squalene-associated FAD-dependent desaturase
VGTVAVVGGGLAGLSAALELQEAGFEVDVYERSRLLGGRATSFEVDGHVVDNGQHVYLACCTEFIRFVKRAGMARALHTQDRFDVAVYSKDGLRSGLRAGSLPAPLHLLTSFAGYAHLSTGGKLRIARALVELRLRPGSATEDRSFAEWLRAHGQSAETMHAFWEPFLVPALNAPLDRMNAAEAAFVISTAFLHDRDAASFGFATVPLAEIMEAAASRLHAVHRASAVLEMRARPEGVDLQTPSGDAHYDAAVLAVPPRALAKLLGDPAAFGVPALDVYEPFAIMDVHLWHDAGALPFDFAALLDSPVQWIFQKAPGYVCCSLSAADALVAVPTAQVVDETWKELRRAVPELAAAGLVRGAATRNPEGTYLARPGTQRPTSRTLLPNLAIAGAWTATGWPDTMESAVRSGLAAARVLLKGNDAGSSRSRRRLAAR